MAESSGDAVDVTIVVPCYRDAGHLAVNVRRVAETMRRTRWSFEILLVDDGSPEPDAEIGRSLEAEMPGVVRLLRHDRNRGRGAAVTTGLRSARGTYAGYLDIDLEVHCCFLPPLVGLLEAGADVAVGRRIYKVGFRSAFRSALSIGYRGVSRLLLSLPAIDTESGFKMFRRERILPVLQGVSDAGWFWDTELIVLALRSGLRVESFPVLFVRDIAKRSTVRVLRDVLLHMRGVWMLRARLRSLGSA